MAKSKRIFPATVINQKCNSIPNDRRGHYKRSTAYSEAAAYLLSRSKFMAQCLDVRLRNAINLIFRSLRPLLTERNRYTLSMGIHGILHDKKRTLLGSRINGPRGLLGNHHGLQATNRCSGLPLKHMVECCIG
jgi:hypothetical protein